MSDTKNNWIDERHYVNAISKKIENLAEPISHPETQLTPQKWINILMTRFCCLHHLDPGKADHQVA